MHETVTSLDRIQLVLSPEDKKALNQLYAVGLPFREELSNLNGFRASDKLVSLYCRDFYRHWYRMVRWNPRVNTYVVTEPSGRPFPFGWEQSADEQRNLSVGNSLIPFLPSMDTLPELPPCSKPTSSNVALANESRSVAGSSQRGYRGSTALYGPPSQRTSRI